MLKMFARHTVPEKIRYLKYGRMITEIVRYRCPRCKAVLNTGPNYQPNYCENCGQKLDFRGVEWVPERKQGRESDDQFKDRVV